MCSVCRSFKCHPSCPNADAQAPVSVGTCEYCENDIMTGDEIVKVDGYLYHYRCLSGLTGKELLDVLDISVKIAESD